MKIKKALQQKLPLFDLVVFLGYIFCPLPNKLIENNIDEQMDTTKQN